MIYKTKRDDSITNKVYVWHKNMCVGYFIKRIFERKDIDWQKYRSDKTLKMSFKERWYAKYYPCAFPNERCNTADSEKEAAKLIIDKHKDRFINFFEEV